jgi:hypothetical protein
MARLNDDGTLRPEEASASEQEGATSPGER